MAGGLLHPLVLSPLVLPQSLLSLFPAVGDGLECAGESMMVFLQADGFGGPLNPQPRPPQAALSPSLSVPSDRPVGDSSPFVHCRRRWNGEQQNSVVCVCVCVCVCV